VFPIELTVARIATEGPPSFTAFIRDITERQRDARALYESREQFAKLARTLQTSLLPPELPQIPGMELAARYHLAVEGIEVGGDFYDVFRTGRSTWGVVMGDVCGKGADAATLTALVRYTIRAAAMVTTQPAQILAMLNEAILRQQGGDNERFATVAYTSVARGRGRTTLTVACGGHPPPLVLKRGGTVVPVGAAGTLLGILREVEVAEITVTLEPGESVTLYTDGLTEAPGPDGEFGADRLNRLVTTCAGLSAHSTAARLEEAVLAHQGGTSRDDLAVLVLKRLGRRSNPVARSKSASALPREDDHG
jgi:serine phosphatase RsbU (regulator of sigma subunit)